MQTRLASYLASLALLGSLALSGCDDNPNNLTREKVTPPPNSALALLLDISETGSVGSNTMLIREELEQLKVGDPAKGDQLIKELDQLEKAADPAKIKSIAKKMADKL